MRSGRGKVTRIGEREGERDGGRDAGVHRTGGAPFKDAQP